MNNAEIAQVFEEMARMLEFQDANPFRVRAYRKAAQTVADLDESLTSFVKQDRDLTKLPGIGGDLAGKIKKLVSDGKLPEYEELKQQVPEGVNGLLRVPRLGPKRAAQLYHELGIKNLADLRKACEEGRVRKVKGFGAKTEKEILEGIDLAAQAEQRMLWARADEYVQDVVAHLRGGPAIDQLEVAGSYRRGKETIGDIDVLVASNDPQKVMDHLAEFTDVQEVLLRGDTKMSVRLVGGLQLDLRVIEHNRFGAALVYFTGSKQHNISIRRRAQERGLKISEYGVFRGEECIASETEAEVYQTLDLPWIPPELREDRGELEQAEERRLPDLIERKHLQADLHMHTTATDGTASLDEMVQAARAAGLKYIAITDHSKRVTMARGLDAKRLRQQWKEIDEYNNNLDDDFLVLKGIECDILETGEMDLPDDVLAEADWVVASIHYGQKQPIEQITERMLNALRNPYVTVIGHPTGRLINSRKSYELDVDAVLQAAREQGKFLELNASPYRLDLNDTHCAMAKRQGIPIVISSDAHSTQGFGDLRYGILQARRAGLTPADVVNTRSWADVKKMLKR